MLFIALIGGGISESPDNTIMMMRHNNPLEISPLEFEQQVADWLSRQGKIKNFRATRSDNISGKSGEYNIDILVSFEIFGGAEIKILAECKRHKDPIKRDFIMILEAKLRDIGAHKGILFSTAGFQKGALEFAKAHGIACISVRDGKSNYHTRAYGQTVEPPFWVKYPKFIGWVYNH